MRFFAGDIIGCHYDNGRAQWRVTVDCPEDAGLIYCDLLVTKTGTLIKGVESRVLTGRWLETAFLIKPASQRSHPMEDTRDYLSAIAGE